MKKLPKTIFVKLDTPDNDEPYLVASDDRYGLAEQGQKVKIGTYKLVEVSNVELVMDVRRAK